MELYQKIFSTFADEADRTVIDEIHMGLGYTMVTLQDGRCGICVTLCDPTRAYLVNTDPNDYEGRSALQLLRHIKDGEHPFSRMMAIALVNAMNQRFAASLPQTPHDWPERLGLGKGASVAMIGHFSPVSERFEEIGSTVRILDLGRNLDNPDDFYPWAIKKADVLAITATSMVNGTLEEILGRFKDRTLPILLMGPSTILHPDIYEGLPINYLSGSAVVAKSDMLKAVRNGRGTLDVHHQAKKVYLNLG